MINRTPTEDLYLKTLEEKGSLTLDELVNLHVPTSRTSNLVLKHIQNLRRKLPKGYSIETVRGWGYRLHKK